MLLQAMVWTGVAAAVLASRSPQPLTRRERLANSALEMGVFLLALLARLRAPFWPLHSNDHAYDDIALVLDLPADNVAARARLQSFGESWPELQKLGLHLTGQTHDGLALLSAFLGALAVLATVMAARRLALPRVPVLLAGALAALVPVGLRVAHSESAFVVAQLLVALALLLGASQPSRWTQIGLAGVILLLATGHALGPGYAFGMALLAWALRHNRWRLLVFLLTVALLGLAMDWLYNGAAIGVRTGGPLGVLGLLRHPQAHTLWLDRHWMPPAWPLLALLGWWACLPAPRWRAALASALGLLALLVTGLLPIACASDVLRYQAPWLPVVALALAGSGRLPAVLHKPLRRPAHLLTIALWLLLALEARELGTGFSALDVQGQTYAALRDALGHERGLLVWLVPEFTGSQRAYLAAPAGRWRDDGPEVLEMHPDVARFQCQRFGHLPGPAVLALEPACLSLPGQSPCDVLRPFLQERLKQQQIARLAPGLASTTAEFLDFAPASLHLEVWRAQCPPGAISTP